MPTLMKVLAMAGIQGLAEFLPISSSGHLVLAKHLLGLHTPGATLEIALHVGTLLSVLVFYRRRLWAMAAGVLRKDPADCRYVGILALASVPAGIVGILFKDRIESLFGEPRLVAGMLLVTAIVLLSTRFARKTGRTVTVLSGFLVGVAQAVAVIPGISRSGSTISAARHLGISPAAAAEFSFLLSIPALLGATVLGASDIAREGMGQLTPAILAAGIAVSAAAGYASLFWLLRVLQSGRLWWFGLYCLAAGCVGVILL